MFSVRVHRNIFPLAATFFFFARNMRHPGHWPYKLSPETRFISYSLSGHTLLSYSFRECQGPLNPFDTAIHLAHTHTRARAHTCARLSRIPTRYRSVSWLPASHSMTTGAPLTGEFRIDLCHHENWVIFSRRQKLEPQPLPYCVKSKRVSLIIRAWGKIHLAAATAGTTGVCSTFSLFFFCRR